MRKALIASYVALVAVVLFTPPAGKSEPQERVVLRHVDPLGRRIVLSDGPVFRFHRERFDAQGRLRMRDRLFRINRERREDLRELRNLRHLDRLEDLPHLRELRLERLNDRRLERLDRLNDQRLDRLERLRDLRQDRLDPLDRLNRWNRDWDSDF